jgi:DnaJ like chaperone protein
MFKWIGLIIGGISYGFWGGFLGWLLGSLVDRLFAPRVKIYTQHYQRSDFMESMLILTAAVLKADGHVERSEFAYVRDYLVRSLGPMQAQEAMNRLTEILGESYNIESVCSELRQSSTIHERLLIIQFLFGVATADGELHQSEVSVIELIAQWSGVARSDYESIKAMFTYSYANNGNNGGYSSGGSGNTGGYRSHTLDSDYQILEISPDATDDEVKKAYRNLAKKYHPDRVAHLGDDMRKAAEEKFSRLSQAYDNIRKSRGMK